MKAHILIQQKVFEAVTLKNLWSNQPWITSRFSKMLLDGASDVPAGPAFELQRGLVSQMVEAGVTVVDRAAIMRITDNALETGEFSRLSPDQRRLEMRALGEHADMLLVFRELTSDQFQVEVLDVRNGSIRVMLSSNGVPPEKAGSNQWKATDRGFQKVEQTVTLDEIGRELALQTLAKLSS